MRITSGEKMRKIWEEKLMSQEERDAFRKREIEWNVYNKKSKGVLEEKAKRTYYTGDLRQAVERTRERILKRPPVAPYDGRAAGGVS